MVKKATSSKSKHQAVAPEKINSTSTLIPPFPLLESKKDLTFEVLEPDQVILIHDIFSPDECKRFTKFVDELPLELTPPPKKGETYRLNHRTHIPSQAFANTLFDLFAPHLPPFPFPAHLRRASPSDAPRRAHSFNSHIRLYRYSPGQHFGPHYDESVRDAATGAHSEWTLLVYLSGAEDGVVGGETIFYKGQGKARKEIKAPLRRGTALLHRHGQACLLHEGAEVVAGTKYVLRSDIMF